MSIRCFIHSLNKRVETSALLDSGATENFIKDAYARRLNLPVRRLVNPRKIVNVDGSPNAQGDIKFFTDFEVQNGERKVNMRFFLTDIGSRDIILGYPWFAAIQLKIDWAKGWIDYTQLPVVLRARTFRPQAPMGAFRAWLTQETTHVAFVAFPHASSTRQSLASKLAEQNDTEESAPLPDEYRSHAKVFSEQEAQRFPGPRH
jgi:hypothetical protein